MEKIIFVKFYQGVNIAQVSNVSSQTAVTERSAQFPSLVKLEKGDTGIIITTNDRNNVTTVTEVPYNNVAYINYEPKQEATEATKVAKKSSEPK